MDMNLGLEFVRVTESAAIAAARWVGCGDKHKADQAAVDEMRKRFMMIDFQGTVVIGEGEKDKAPQLYQGEKLGSGKGLVVDLAIDPLEATDSVAYGRYNALSVIVGGPKGSLLSAPDTYMDKIAVGVKAKGRVSLDTTVAENIRNVARALDKKESDVVVVLLDRPRHEKLIQEIRDAGARIRLITDGDVAAAIAICMPDSEIDILMGIGGSTESVLAAAPVKILGGEILSRFVKTGKLSKEQEESIDYTRIYTAEDMARGNDLLFSATGVIDGPLLSGVKIKDHYQITHSLVMRGKSGTLRYITAYHKEE